MTQPELVSEAPPELLEEQASETQNFIGIEQSKQQLAVVPTSAAKVSERTSIIRGRKGAVVLIAGMALTATGFITANTNPRATRAEKMISQLAPWSETTAGLLLVVAGGAMAIDEGRVQRRRSRSL